MDAESVLRFLSQEGPSFMLGSFVGLIFARFSLSKSDIKRIEQEKFQNSNERRKALEERYLAFTGSLKRYISKKNAGGSLSLDDFIEVSDAGALYFAELKTIGDAILSDKIDRVSRDSTFVPAIHDAILKSLPAYYKELSNMANTLNVPYSGKLDERNYKSLYAVAERFGGSRTVPQRIK